MGFFFTFAVAGGPRRVESAPSQLVFRDGGGLGTTLFGLPFLVLGVFLLAILIRLVINLFLTPPTGSEWILVAIAFVILLGNFAMFTAFGVWSVFGRRGVALDKQEGIISIWWSLPFRHRSTVHRLSDYRTVKVERTGGSVRTGPTYSVVLHSSTCPSLAIATVTVSQMKADRLASEIAGFLGAG